MEVQVYSSSHLTGLEAARDGAAHIRAAIERRGEANIVVATGASQFHMLHELVSTEGIDWSCVTGFHLDEYISLPFSHRASFRHYLADRFVGQLPTPLKAFHYLNGETHPEAECQRVGAILVQRAIDVAFVGIGENGHLAFNDPPADFEISEPYLCVELDEACRRQQFGEGWFDSLAEVPTRAITMSIRQILKSEHIICTVPDSRKADAVRDAVEGPISPAVPASILQSHPATTLYLDTAAASKLSGRPSASRASS